MTRSASATRLRCAEAGDLSALTAALQEAAPVAPLPADPVERQAALTMLRPDLPIQEPDTAAVLATSGSTGRPKGVVLSRAAVAASVAGTEERLGGPGDWALALPTAYVAGFLVVARCTLAGTNLWPVAPDLSDLPAVVRAMGGRRYLSLVPTQLVRGCATPATAAALAQFDAVLVGGAGLPADQLATARELGIPVVPTYGMTETCGGCVYDGRPLPGVDVRCAVDGRISIRGPVLFTGYRLQPELTAQVLQAGTFATSDRGRWAAGRLEVTGRTDDVVVTGGRNVDLAELERAARSWPAVRGGDIAVLAVPDPEWGALIVAVTDRPGTLVDLRAHLARSLPGYAAPRRLVQLDRLPRLGSGKLDRQRLLADLTAEVQP